MYAKAKSNSNIAFIKYWGNADTSLRLPVNDSISMNLEGVFTTTEITFLEDMAGDSLILNGVNINGPRLMRVTRFLDHIRDKSGSYLSARVVSTNNFPTGAGIASSASAFSALAVAAAAALNLDLSERELSAIARLGSGSACRSIPDGFVEWKKGHSHDTSYAQSFASTDHWDLVDLIVIIDSKHKAVGSTGGHELAKSSPLQEARVSDTPRRFEICKEAILNKDFEKLASIIEQDALIMHSVMMTSQPSLIYWHPNTLALIIHVRKLRMEGVKAAFTIDAGANVHIIAGKDDSDVILNSLDLLPFSTQTIIAETGAGASLIIG